MIVSLRKKLIELSRERPDLFFVQIGANDGYTHDPIYKYIKEYNWSGILVEPVSEYFDNLKKTYSKEQNLIFAKVAISSKAERKTLFGFSKKAPYWIRLNTRTKNSFSKKTILSHSWYMPNLSKYIVKEKVEAVTLRGLLKRHKARKVDLLFIDTEGYDYEILKQVDFKKIKPLAIYYEHKHLTKEDKMGSWRTLAEKGYKLERGLFNTFAFLER